MFDDSLMDSHKLIKYQHDTGVMLAWQLHLLIAWIQADICRQGGSISSKNKRKLSHIIGARTGSPRIRFEYE